MLTKLLAPEFDRVKKELGSHVSHSIIEGFFRERREGNVSTTPEGRKTLRRVSPLAVEALAIKNNVHSFQIM